MSANSDLDPHSALRWPFFEPRHRELARGHRQHGPREPLDTSEHDDVDAACRHLVRELGAAGWLRYGVGGAAYGGHGDTIDTRAVCLLRETLARHIPVSPTSRWRCRASAPARSRSAARDAQKTRYLPRVANGDALSPRSRLSEPEAGSDVAAMSLSRARRRRLLRARRREDVDLERRHRRLLRRVRHGPARRRARAASPPSSSMPTRRGCEIAERIDVIAPHPLARLRFDGARVPRSQHARRTRRRFQARDAHARYLPHLGGGGVAWASRGARWTKVSRAQRRARCSARRSATFS